MKKKLISLLFITLITVGVFSYNILAQENVSVYINGTKILFDVDPQIINGRTMVPMRTIFEKLGAKVDWEQNTQTITGTKEDTIIIMQIDNNELKVNNKTTILDVAPTIINSRTLVPVRAVAESLGVDVIWNGDIQVVSIHENKSNIEYVQLYDTNGIQNNVEKSLVKEYESLGWSDNATVAIANAVPKQNVMVFEKYLEMNSVDGVSAEIIWRNNSNKTIKYIYFYAVPYNAVGDPVACEVTGMVERKLSSTGPHYAFDKNNLGRYPYFYNEGDRQFVETDKATGKHYLITSIAWDDFEPWEEPVYNKRYLTKDEYDYIFDIKCEWDPIWYNSTIKDIAITKIEVQYMDGTSEIIENPPIWRDVFINAGL